MWSHLNSLTLTLSHLNYWFCSSWPHHIWNDFIQPQHINWLHLVTFICLYLAPTQLTSSERTSSSLTTTDIIWSLVTFCWSNWPHFIFFHVTQSLESLVARVTKRGLSTENYIFIYWYIKNTWWLVWLALQDFRYICNWWIVVYEVN